MSKGSGKFAAARFCPFCGVESLDRDTYGETLTPRRNKNEFACRSCGMGFMLTPSLRYQAASGLAKSHRASNFVNDVHSRPPGKRI